MAELWDHNEAMNLLEPVQIKMSKFEIAIKNIKCELNYATIKKLAYLWELT